MAEARKYTIKESSRLCGVSIEDIREFAALYKDSSPTALSVGNGIERNRNGGNGIRAIYALAALADKFGLRGGGIIGGSGNLFPKTPDRLQRPDLAPPGTRTINIID